MSGELIRYVARSSRRRRLTGPGIRSAAAVMPRVAPPHRPVFVLGAPRSGTTMLFQLLGRSPHLASLPGEAHLLWELFHPDPGATSTGHGASARDVTERERRALYWLIRRITGGRRYLDKTPRNSVRVPYLDGLFADASFVFLKRDGRAVVSSLMTAWRSGSATFPGTPVPGGLSIEGYDGSNWKFVLPPDWKRYAHGHTLAEVCAHQWVASNEAILAGREVVDSARWIEVGYEDLVATPAEETARLLDALGLPQDGAVMDHARGLERHVTRVAVSPPRPDKWREENGAAVRSVLGLIAPTMERLGYQTED